MFLEMRWEVSISLVTATVHHLNLNPEGKRPLAQSNPREGDSKRAKVTTSPKVPNKAATGPTATSDPRSTAPPPPTEPSANTTPIQPPNPAVQEYARAVQEKTKAIMSTANARLQQSMPPPQLADNNIPAAPASIGALFETTVEAAPAEQAPEQMVVDSEPIAQATSSIPMSISKSTSSAAQQPSPANPPPNRPQSQPQNTTLATQQAIQMARSGSHSRSQSTNLPVTPLLNPASVSTIKSSPNIHGSPQVYGTPHQRGPSQAASSIGTGPSPSLANTSPKRGEGMGGMQHGGPAPLGGPMQNEAIKAQIQALSQANNRLLQSQGNDQSGMANHSAEAINQQQKMLQARMVSRPSDSAHFTSF